MKSLVVEPSRPLLHSLERLLLSMDFEVQVAFDGVIACNDFAEDTDVLFISSDTPRLPALEVVSLLKKRKPDLIAVLLLNDFAVSEKTLVENNIINDFISSPFVADEIDALIERTKSRREEQGPFLTLKERALYEALQKGEAEYGSIYKHISKAEEVPAYIAAIKKKYPGTDIHYTDKGLKLVNSNV